MADEVHGGVYIPQTTGTFGSQIWVAVLSGAVAIVISGGAWIFSQGQNQAVITELTRRIAAVEANTVGKNDLLDVERRLTNLETNGSPALGSLRAETANNQQRITQLEANIPRALSEASLAGAQQDQKIATNQTQLSNIERRVQILENGSIPPLSDRMAALQSSIAVLSQQASSLRADIENLRSWRASQSDDAVKDATAISGIIARLSAIEDGTARLRDRVVEHEQSDARAVQEELNRLHMQIQQRDTPTLGQPK